MMEINNTIESDPCIFEKNKKLKNTYINVIVYQVTDKKIMH